VTAPGILAALVQWVGVPLNLLVTVLLLRLARSSPNPVVRERALAALVVLLNVIVFALIFWNNDQLVPPIDLAMTKLITRAQTLGLATLPALYWLYLYRRASA
jgi:hypothetical protein